MAAKAERRLSLMKRLGGRTWGASEAVLGLAYKTYVRPVMEYGSEVVSTASDTALKKLSLAQNKALRLVTGAPCSTPILAMEVQTSTEPLSTLRERATANLYEKMVRNDIRFWEDYRIPSQRLKTQEPFMIKAKAILDDMGLSWSDREPFPAIDPPSDWPAITFELQLIEDVEKRNTPEHELRSLALETIRQRYPAENWFHVYTDGSAESAVRNAGAGVYSEHFQISAAAGEQGTNFDGEVTAIHLALKEISKANYNNVVIFVDSQAAILAVASPRVGTSLKVLESRSLLGAISAKGSNIVFQWVPSHCGLLGNEEADRLAREGTKKPQTILPVPFSSARRAIKSISAVKLAQSQREGARGKTYETLLTQRIPQDLPRRDGVACFRLATGHHYLQSHLYKIGVVTDKICVLCHQGIMDKDHLDTCSALAHVRNNTFSSDYRKKSELYWAARSQMADSQ